MANFFSDFWKIINKKLVPRNATVKEDNSTYFITLQNANGHTPQERENLVTFSIPKSLSFTASDREDLTTIKNYNEALLDAGISSTDLIYIKQAAGVSNRVTALETATNKNDSNNAATTETAGYMTPAQVEQLNATVTVPATPETAGYMSAKDKTDLDTLKLYSQQYTLIYADDEIQQEATYKSRDVQYGFKFNTNTNPNIAEIDPDLTRITIKQDGTYLILATGCIVPQLTQQDTRTANAFTMRVIHGRGEENNISLVEEKVSGGMSIASANIPFTDNWFTSGTTFTVANLQANDKLALIATHPVRTPQIMWHQNCRIFLFKTLSMQESVSIPLDSSSWDDIPDPSVNPPINTTTP